MNNAFIKDALRRIEEKLDLLLEQKNQQVVVKTDVEQASKKNTGEGGRG